MDYKYAKYKALHDEGLTNLEIAFLFGVTRQAVSISLNNPPTGRVSVKERMMKFIEANKKLKEIKCKQCTLVKPVSEFPWFKKHGSFYRYDSSCRKCRALQVNEYTRKMIRKDEAAWRKRRNALQKKAYIKAMEKAKADPVRMAKLREHWRMKNMRATARGYYKKYYYIRKARRDALVDKQASSPAIQAILKRIRGF